MPNTTQTFQPSGESDTRKSSSHVDSTTEKLIDETKNTAEAHSNAHSHSEDEQDAGGACFSNNGDEEGDGWLTSDVTASLGQTTQDEPETGAQAQEKDSKTTSDRNASHSTSQHSSSMSFARTVSHEISFGDDDDGDWALSRNDTDPFKFMPLSDRSNSFPIVPPMAVDVNGREGGPLPSNQALDVLEETERDFEADEEQYEAQHPQVANAESQRGRHTASRSIGGDIRWAEAQASEARYEEGVPLISHSNGDEEHAADSSLGGGAIASFSDDENDDDFFNQVPTNGNDHGNGGAEMQSLQRKSTMQVLASMNSDMATQRSGLENTLEEEENTERTANLTAGSQIPRRDDIVSKWQEAFAGDDDDDDFLLDDVDNRDDVDPAAFLGSDDEGFLDDNEEPAPADIQTKGIVPSQGYGSNSYLPQNMAQQPMPAPYMPAVAHPAQTSIYGAPLTTAPLNANPSYSHVPLPRPEQSKTQSFADKSKGGYSSPYDLPTDLVSNTVKPRKRPSVPQLVQDSPPLGGPHPPARSASISASVPPPSSSAPGISNNQPPSAPPLRNKGSFFEELPIASKPRPISRQSNRAPSPSPYTLTGQSPHGPSPLSPPMANQMQSSGPAASYTPASPPGGVGLVAPDRVGPYAALQSSIPPAQSPSANTSRYSPAPLQSGNTIGVPPPAAASRYSPAPPAARPGNTYPSSGPTAVHQSMLPHLPRTSSPLAHFEINSERNQALGQNTNGDMIQPARRVNSSHEPRLTRVSSLPPTREVEEEEDQAAVPRSISVDHPPPTQIAELRYSPTPPPQAIRRTPPPAASSGQAMLSPVKRPSSNYVPQAVSSPQSSFVPPQRAEAHSPGLSRGGRQVSTSVDSGRRPGSSHAPQSPVLAKSAQPPYNPHAQRRPQSLTMNLIAPTDGRENDALQRWQGVPIISWGVGGTIVTSFPKSIPRYVMNQTTPSMLRASGEVKVQSIKDVAPLEDQLTKFPGPLKGKSKKKEVISWLTAGIEDREKEFPDVSYNAQLSLETKRSIERMLLWKLLRVFIENDGVLEGNLTVEKSVRDILSPHTMAPATDNDAVFPTDLSGGLQASAATSMSADGADAATTEKIRRDLFQGDRESAVWAAVDKRLWGHAMLISHTVSPDLYKRVAQEFVRKEVNHTGHSNESLAALYKVLSGNHDDCVDELVPVHARAGFQLMSTDSRSGSANDTIDGLDKWRETLSLILSNRSAEDIRGLNALGKLLAGYGRAEAAHICFIFSRSVSVFGGVDDPNVDFVLLGSDHRLQGDHFAKEDEALQLSEIYEYGLSLSASASATSGAPHLAVYKLYHAMSLAEYGHRDKALQYCDAIEGAIASQTRRSHYYNVILESAVDDLMRRLKQAPKEEGSSWMSKPSMNKVSDSMWNRFNKFVAGDEQENSGNGASGDGENGPFARIATTPTMSRSPSVSNFEVYGAGGSPGYPTNNTMPLAPSAMSSRYAPNAAHQAGMASSYDSASAYIPSSMPIGGRTSNEYSGNSFETPHYGASPEATQNGGYFPMGASSYGSTYQPVDLKPNATNSNGEAAFNQQPSNIGQFGQGFQPEPASYGYEPPQTAASSPNDMDSSKMEGDDSTGYEPPSFQSYGYEPPSYELGPEPSAENDDDTPKPKKKSFMDDDDDDIPSLRPQAEAKSDKDRENEEMFRKAAEEDGKLVFCFFSHLLQIAN